MAYRLLVFEFIPYGAADSLRHYAHSTGQYPPPMCGVDCNGDGTPDIFGGEICATLATIESQFRTCVGIAINNSQACMNQFLRLGLGGALACGVLCIFTIGTFCGGCLITLGLLLFDRLQNCDQFHTDLENCKLARDIARNTAIENACP